MVEQTVCRLSPSQPREGGSLPLGLSSVSLTESRARQAIVALLRSKQATEITDPNILCCVESSPPGFIRWQRAAELMSSSGPLGDLFRDYKSLR